METIVIGALVLCSLVWLMLIVARGGFWRAMQRLPDAPDPAHWLDVAIVIPARNEAAQIDTVLAGHAAGTYPGRTGVFVADDHSTDGTGRIARNRAEVIDVPDLPDGWSGKLWALETGIAQADRAMPGAAWLLLTDADILHTPGTLARLVALGEARGLGLVSLMARLDARGLWGRLLIPAFVFFFQKLYPFAWVNATDTRTAAAAGGCVLIRRDVLKRIGGIRALRGALIDDCTLADHVKASGAGLWLGLASDEVVSLRDNRTLGSVWHMVRRTAFTQLRHSPVLLAGSVLGMAVTYVVPLAAIAFGGWPAIWGGTLWAVMAAAYWPICRLYGLAWGWALALPLAALFYAAMTVDSAWAHWRGRGGMWKGRSYQR